MSVFRDVTVVAKCFWAFIQPVLEYCSPVWMSGALPTCRCLIVLLAKLAN